MESQSTGSRGVPKRPSDTHNPRRQSAAQRTLDSAKNRDAKMIDEDDDEDENYQVDFDDDDEDENDLSKNNNE